MDSHPLLELDTLIELDVTLDPDTMYESNRILIGTPVPRLKFVSTPNRRRPLMIHEIFQSSVHPKFRMENIKIHSPLQLTASEIQVLHKHLLNFLYSNPANHSPRVFVSYSCLEKYVSHIFNKSWDSDKHPGPMPFMRDQTFQDCSVQAGVFKHDLSPNPGQSVVSPERQKDAPAFLMVSINQDDMTVTSRWKDSKGGDAKYEDVAMDMWTTKEKATRHAIEWYDYRERDRVYRYNWKLCVYAGRKQVMEFARTGIQAGQFPKAHFIPPQKVVPIRHHIREMINFWGDAARVTPAPARIDPSEF
ncbi:hypothetical protein NW762_007643 [Fusarium torreyae]|uniref:Uncharacterized protein n=1 Tax=Fusarium torreyae TaxID=1237075 RepID=A0A9W8VCZ7_9HYPO|nr:hypothetical protein NW762_007643 [Fusarium torreyae]